MADVNKIADLNADEVGGKLDKLSSDELNELRRAETAGKNRKSVMSAIDEASAALDGGISARNATMDAKFD